MPCLPKMAQMLKLFIDFKDGQLCDDDTLCPALAFSRISCSQRTRIGTALTCAFDEPAPERKSEARWVLCDIVYTVYIGTVRYLGR